MDCFPKQTLLLLTALIAPVFFAPQTGQAQIPVIDGANLEQNIQIFLKDAAMLAIMIDNIKKARGDSEAIVPLLNELAAVIKQGEALAYSSQDIAGTFQDKFPGYQLPEGPWADRSQLWTKTQLDTLRNILEAVHKQNENYGDEQDLVEGILEQSNAAIGHMQALQQGNALVGATVKQLAKLRQLLMSQINADTVYRAAEATRRAEAEARGVTWGTAVPPVVEPMSPNDARGIGDLEFICPRR